MTYAGELSASLLDNALESNGIRIKDYIIQIHFILTKILEENGNHPGTLIYHDLHNCRSALEKARDAAKPDMIDSLIHAGDCIRFLSVSYPDYADIKPLQQMIIWYVELARLIPDKRLEQVSLEISYSVIKK
jgi:hypothetical protein